VDGPGIVSGFSDRLRLEHVPFAYGDAPVLEDVNLEIRRGETVMWLAAPRNVRAVAGRVHLLGRSILAPWFRGFPGACRAGRR